MKPHNTQGLARIYYALRWSWAGLRHAVVHEAAFRQEVCLALFLLPLGLWLGQSHVEKILLAGSLLLVLIIELLNSSLEAAVDRISTEEHPLAGHAKDMGSAAVFISLLNVLLVWGIIIVW